MNKAEWRERALQITRDFVTNVRRFQCVELQEFAYARGLPKPDNGASWGSVMVRARKEGLIEKVGISYREFTLNPQTHIANVAMWQSRI